MMIGMATGLMVGVTGFQAAHLGYRLLAPWVEDNKVSQTAGRIFKMLSSFFALGSGVGALWMVDHHFALASTLFNVGGLGACFTLVGGVATLILCLGCSRHLLKNAVQYLNRDSRIESDIDYLAPCRKAIREALGMIEWAGDRQAIKAILEGQLNGELNPDRLIEAHNQLVQRSLQGAMAPARMQARQGAAMLFSTFLQNQQLQQESLSQQEAEQEQLQGVLEKAAEACEYAASHVRAQQIYMKWQEEPERERLQLDLIVGIISGVILSLLSSYFWVGSTLLQVALLVTTLGREGSLSINHSVNVSNFDGKVSIDLLLKPVYGTAGKICVICQEVMGRIGIQPCNQKEHVFHGKCIGGWISKQGAPFMAGIKKVVTVDDRKTTFYISKEGEHMPSCPMCRSEMRLPAEVQMVSSAGEKKSASIEWVDKDWVYRPVWSQV